MCVASLIVYPINRFYLKPHHIGGWFTHGYLNDVLCLPLFVPMILYVQYVLGVRKHRDFPRLWEVFQSFLAFTLVFQFITPRFPKTFITAGDHYDIIAYFAGGLVACIYWSRVAREGVRRIEDLPAEKLGVQNHDVAGGIAK